MSLESLFLTCFFVLVVESDYDIRMSCRVVCTIYFLDEICLDALGLNVYLGLLRVR